MFYFQQHCHCHLFCSSEQVRTLLPSFLLPPRNTTIIPLEGGRSWKKVYEEQRATSMKRLCRGLYNNDIAHSMMVLSCLKKYLNLFLNCKSRATALKWATTRVLAGCQPVPLTVHLHLQNLIGFVLILCETQSNRGSRKQIFIFEQASRGSIRIWPLKQLLAVSPPCLEGSPELLSEML